MPRSRLLWHFLIASGIAAAIILLTAVLLERQVAPVFAQPKQIRLLAWIFIASVMLLILLVAVVHSRLVTHRIERVLRGMEEIRQGRYPRLLVEGKDELAELTRGFNQAVEELRSRDEKLKRWAEQRESTLFRLSQSLEEERGKLETVLESIGDGVVVLDSENKVLMANRRVSEIFGVPMGALTRADLSKLIEQVRHRLLHPDVVGQKLQELQRSPELVEEITLELDEPGGPAIRLYCAPLRGVDGKVLGRIATWLDLGKERELDRLKTEFLSTISHELRTPLTSVKGALGLIRGGAAGAISADMRELLDIGLSNTERLIHVINEILDISQLERGQARIRPGSLSLAQSVTRASLAVATWAESQGVTIKTQFPEDLPAVKADPKRVEQVLVNLLSNAIKFSPSGQRVIVAAQAKDKMVVVSVRDFGKGMSKEFQQRLFAKFEHAHAALTRESQGAGLGLAICRHILDAHGGQIWVESEAGSGSTFYFSLPAVERRGPTPLLPGKPAEAPVPARRLILVIDDDEDTARVISYVFETQGHRVISAQNGREAIELARKHRPDLMTLDMLMPDMDGYAVLQTLRSDEETRKIPVICISVEPDPSLAISRGADYYLEKPLEIDKLREIAQRALTAG
jgi:signal transduction histidine kinase